MDENLRCFLFAISAIILVSGYEQNDYTLNHHFIQVTYYNHSWVNKFTIENVKPNRTYKALNIYVDVKRIVQGEKIKIRIQAYWFLSNEYKKSPILFDLPYCRTLERRSFGIQELFEHGNCTKCPLRPGVYYIKNFAPKQEHFPPFVPEGEYMFQVKIISGDGTISELKWYGNIVSRRRLRTEKPLHFK